MKKKEKKQLKEEKAKIKKAKSMHKKMATTMEWSDIERIEDNRIWLKRNDKEMSVVGVKITPRDILIDADYIQANIVNNLRIAFNKLNTKIYWGFIFTPVDIDEHISNLLMEEEKEENIIRNNMIKNDFDKAIWFQESFRELEFCFLLKDSDERRLLKNYDNLVAEFIHAGFSLKQMGNEDFYNYLAYLFENPLINDFYFSRGVFDCLLVDDTVSTETQNYEADFDYDEYYTERGNI